MPPRETLLHPSVEIVRITLTPTPLLGICALQGLLARQPNAAYHPRLAAMIGEPQLHPKSSPTFHGATCYPTPLAVPSILPQWST